jgi:hypothetical protein
MYEIPLPSPFTRRQALDAGLIDHQLRTWTRDGVVRRVLQSVYADASLPDNLLVRTAALRLVTTPATVVADRTAAWLHGVDTFAYRELEILRRSRSVCCPIPTTYDDVASAAVRET